MLIPLDQSPPSLGGRVTAPAIPGQDVDQNTAIR
jgi:hypothetical protein